MCDNYIFSVSYCIQNDIVIGFDVDFALAAIVCEKENTCCKGPLEIEKNENKKSKNEWNC